MDVFKNTKKTKKFILVIAIIMLFSFTIPKQINAAGLMDWDIKGALSDLLFWIERGLIKTVNNIFCDERHEYEYDSDNPDNTKIYISPETIIKGKFALLDPNIFEEVTTSEAASPEKDKYYDTHDSGGGSLSLNGIVEGKKALRETIAGWYYALRNFAIIALLSILVYVGIRMIMSTLSQDKAKYKMMLKDWLVSICLVMMMHYIMIGTLQLSSLVTKAIGTEGQNSNSMQDLITKISMINEQGDKDNDHEIYLDNNNQKASKGTGKLYTIGDAFALELVLLGVFGYTLIFAIKYLLRMMTIVFLILVAPITAITYPIDKISDGKAQAFNMWLQEFLYEVIIQPFHLLIYVVLVGSATTLATTNWIYSIMCFAVMIPAEKFIKQMFGFKDKLSSPLGAFAGGALASQLMSKAFSGGGSSADKSPKVEGKSESDEGFRENKLKPGYPGANSGTGEPTKYDYGDEEEKDDSFKEDDNTPPITDMPEDSVLPEDDPNQQPEIDNPEDNSNNDNYNGGPSAADAYQNSDNPVRDAELAALDEKFAEGEMDRKNYEEQRQDILYKHDGIPWHQDLTTDQIDELNAEGIRPHHPEYDRYLADHGIKKDNEQQSIPQPMPQPTPKPIDPEPIADEEETPPIYTPNTEDVIDDLDDDDSDYTYPDYDEKPSEDTPNEPEEPQRVSKMENAWNAVREHHDKKLVAKYGTTSKAKVAGKYLARKGSKYGKKAIKGASTLLAAGAAGVVGTMFGQGGKAALAGAAVGSRIGNKINDKASSAYKTAAEYTREAIYATKDEDQRRKEKVAKMMDKPEQIEKASRSFSKRNNGRIATKKEREQELAERAKFKETGLTDSQIDDAMGIYHKNIDTWGEEKAFALAHASTQLASQYKHDDLLNSSKVGNEFGNIMEAYAKAGVNQDVADEMTRAIIKNAAEIHNIDKPALPPTTKKAEYKADKNNVNGAKASYARRHNGVTPTKQQLDNELEMGYNLRRAGIGTADRDKFFNEYLVNDEARQEAAETIGPDATEEEIDNELERRFEIKIKAGIQDEKDLTSQIGEATVHIQNTQNIEKPSSGQVYKEIKQRLTVRDSYHISESSIEETNAKISEIRRDEEKFVKQSSDKDGAKAVLDIQRKEANKAVKSAEEKYKSDPQKDAKVAEERGKVITKAKYQRQFLSTHSFEEMKNDIDMDKAAKGIIAELDKSGVTDTETHKKEFASEVINSSRKMVGIKERFNFKNL